MSDSEEEDRHPVRKYNRKTRTGNDMIPPLFGPQQLYSLHLDIRSPRFKAACLSLGVMPEECVLKYDLVSYPLARPIEQFDAKTKDKNLAEKRYEHYMQRLIKTINAVLLERHRLSKTHNHRV